MRKPQQDEKRRQQQPPEEGPQAFINIGESRPEELAEQLRAFGFEIDLIDQGRT